MCSLTIALLTPQLTRNKNTLRVVGPPLKVLPEMDFQDTTLALGCRFRAGWKSAKSAVRIPASFSFRSLASAALRTYCRRICCYNRYSGSRGAGRVDINYDLWLLTMFRSNWYRQSFGMPGRR